MNNNFRIVKIIDDKSLVINAGRNYNIQEGDEFEIFSEGKPIIDPVTKENLGKLDFIKDTLVVSVVYDKMCICTTPITYNSPLTNSFSSILGTKEQRLLNVSPLDISGNNYLDENKEIKIGDLARLLPRVEEKNTENEIK